MNSSGAIGARTARACDSCLHRRARWFCAADDAFLCQQCDVSVHSANPLARRHERIRLETASSSAHSLMLEFEEEAPAWLHGLKRKARTPRKKAVKVEEGLETRSTAEPLVVPDLEALLADDDDDEEHLMCRVPIVEAALLAELNSPMPVEQFTAAEDIEALLGRGLDEEAFCLDELGWNDKIESVKVELELGGMDANGVGLSETKDGVCELGGVADYQQGIHFDMKFDDDENVKGLQEHKGDVSNRIDRCLILKLDYEAVIAAWSSGKDCTSPWTDGKRPLLSSDEILSNCFSAMWGMGNVQGTSSRLNGREARVTRYREKRQTRLFSKKIRYEVRKLNAEKRPRMKGRFVKRVPGTFPSASASYPY